MEFHEAANLFPMEEETIDELAKDIKENGQIETIKLYFDKIIDGRRRFTACEKAGIKPMFEAINTTDPVAYVLSTNLHRRHLTPSQKSMIAARVRDIYDEQARERQLLGLKKGDSPVVANLPGREERSRDAAGKAVGVGGKSVDHAGKVLKHGVPELIKAVDEGRIAVSTAAIHAISETPEKQKEIAENSNRTYQRKPKTKQQIKEPPEIKKARENGTIYNAGRYAIMVMMQIDRIEQSDPTAIESLKKIIDYANQIIQKWS